MNLETIRRTLVAAGLPSYAIVDCDGPAGRCLSVRFEDLPAEGENPSIDDAIQTIRTYDVSDKGLVFTPTAPANCDAAGFPLHAGNPVWLD